MRTIKFRAWDKNIKEMIYPMEAHELNAIVMELNGNLLKLMDEDLANNTAKPAGVILPDSMVLMQYTGLKDKNGKEIYEGDIVDVSIKYDRLHLAQIEWHEDYGMFIVNNINDIGFQGFEHTESELIEVIGNIYQNPQLLKKL